MGEYGKRFGSFPKRAVVAFYAASALPINILGPGDHEQKSCGTALNLDLARWQGHIAEDLRYWEIAYRRCTSERIDRVIQAVGVVSATILIVTFVSARTRRSSWSSESGT